MKHPHIDTHKYAFSAQIASILTAFFVALSMGWTHQLVAGETVSCGQIVSGLQPASGGQTSASGLSHSLVKMGIAFEAPNGDIHMMLDDYVIGDHQLLLELAEKNFGKVRPLWGGEMIVQYDEDQLLRILQINTTSGYFKDYYTKVPSSIIDRNHQKFLQFLNSDELSHVVDQSHKIDSFNENAPYFSPALNAIYDQLMKEADLKLTDEQKQQGVTPRVLSVRHTLVNRIGSIVTWMQLLEFAKRDQRLDLQSPKHPLQTLSKRREVFQWAAMTLQFLLEQNAAAAMGIEEQTLRNMAVLFSQIGDSMLLELYDNDELRKDVEEFAYNVSRYLQLKGSESDSYQIF